MFRSRKRMTALAGLALTVALVACLTPAPRSEAADHADGPTVAHDQASDLADVFIFLDPNDNSKLILAGTFHGFITPGEAVNFAIFDENVRYRLELEFTGDAKPDRFLDVRFSPKTSAAPQIATVTLPNGRTFTAPTTNPNLSPTPPEPTVTTDATSGVSFFAGLVDDPFNFDIPAFSRATAPVRNGTGPVDAAQLQRGRDTFAGYNILAFAMSIPVALMRSAGAVNEIGVNMVAQRRSNQTVTRQGSITGTGRWMQVDRAAIPGVNAVFIPVARKNEFNAATTLDDQNGRFADKIVSVLRALGTDDTSIGLLASVAVQRGDMLRLSLSVQNTGRQGGGFRSDAPGDRNGDSAGFPNGRRVGDDVIDTLLFLVNNRQPLGDSVNANDVPFRSAFPFFGAPHQPFPPGTADDRTRN